MTHYKSPDDYTNQQIQEANERYATRLGEGERQHTITAEYAMHSSPASIEVPSEDMKLPLDIQVNGVPYNTIGTISVLDAKDSGAPHTAEQATALARTHFALLRRPYSDEVFLTQLHQEVLDTGYAEIDESNLAAIPQDRTTFTTQVSVQTRRGSDEVQPTPLEIRYDPRRGGSYDVTLRGYPGPSALVVQPHQPHTNSVTQ